MSLSPKAKVRKRQKGFLIGFVFNESLRFVEYPMIYDTKKEAIEAIKRLSKDFPQITFTVSELQHYVKVPQ